MLQHATTWDEGPQNELEGEDFGIPWSSMPWLDSNLLSIEVRFYFPPNSPNSLPVASKANSIHDLMTSSSLVAFVWHSMESFHLITLSRMECTKAVGRVLFLIFNNDLADSGKSSLSIC